MGSKFPTPSPGSHGKPQSPPPPPPKKFDRQGHYKESESFRRSMSPRRDPEPEDSLGDALYLIQISVWAAGVTFVVAVIVFLMWVF